VSAPPPGYGKRERTADVFEESPTKKSKRMSLTVYHTLFKNIYFSYYTIKAITCAYACLCEFLN
jgi:hypothetical protein